MELLLIMGVLLLVIWVSVLRPSPDDLSLWGCALQTLDVDIDLSIYRYEVWTSDPMDSWHSWSCISGYARDWVTPYTVIPAVVPLWAHYS